MDGSFADVTPTGDYMLYKNEGVIHCVTARDGKDVASAVITTNEYRSVAIAAKQATAYVWTQEGTSPLGGHIIYSFSIPNLTKSVAIRPDWYAARAFLYRNIIIGTTVGRTDAFDLTSGKKVWRGRPNFEERLRERYGRELK